MVCLYPTWNSLHIYVLFKSLVCLWSVWSSYYFNFLSISEGTLWSPRFWIDIEFWTFLAFLYFLHFPWIISSTQYIFPNQLLFRDIKIKLHIIERKSQQPISEAVGNCSHKPKQRLNIGPIFASDNTTFPPSSPTLISLKIDTFSISFTGKMGKVFKSGLSKFFKGCLPQNLLSPLLNTLSQITDLSKALPK